MSSVSAHDFTVSTIDSPTSLKDKKLCNDQKPTENGHLHHHPEGGSTPSTPGNVSENDQSIMRQSQISRTSLPAQSSSEQRHIIHRHAGQRSWKSRFAASMRQARDFLSRPRALVHRRNSTRRTNTLPSFDEALYREVKLDVNLATKAELARLPGIDSSLASAIVEHRKLLVENRFKRIDDLINVSGFDVGKLNRIRDLIVISRATRTADGANHVMQNRSFVVPSKPAPRSPALSDDLAERQSGVMSLSPSISGLRLSFEGSNMTPLQTTPVVNLNKANEQELIDIAGFPSSAAKRIVEHRINHGPFQNVADIRRIKGISKNLFVKVRER